MLNMDMNIRVIIDSTQLNWQPSPLSGVWRKPLAREDAETGHATSIVRFDTDSRFSEHGHPLGEEILVLDGIFSDHTGDYAAGSYIRNPPGFFHAPFSLKGYTLFVKLHQFLADDTHRVCINYKEKANDRLWKNDGKFQSLRLHQWEPETVQLIRSLSEPTRISLPRNSNELLVIEGSIEKAGEVHKVGSWLRSPNTDDVAITLSQHSMLWIKSGHL